MQTRHSTLKPIFASEAKSVVLASESEVSTDLLLVLQQEANAGAVMPEIARTRRRSDISMRRFAGQSPPDILAGILGLASLVSESESIASSETPIKRAAAKSEVVPRKKAKQAQFAQLLHSKLSAQYLPTGLPLRGTGLLAASLDLYLRSMTDTPEDKLACSKPRKAAIHVAIALFIRSDKERLARFH